MRKIDPNKSPEDVDALIRLGLMIEKHKDVVTEELDEDGESERSIRISRTKIASRAASIQPKNSASADDKVTERCVLVNQWNGQPKKK